MAPVLHKIPRHDTDTTADFVLLRAEIPALADSLNLQATENENAFYKTFPVETLSTLRAKTFRVKDDEFLRVLKGILLDDYGGGRREDFGDFSMTAAVDGSQLNISIRKDVNGVKTRVCALNLPSTDPDEANIDLFAWAAEATAHRVRLSDEFSSMQSSTSEATEEMEQMKKKFKDLVEAKKKHEQELLAKFALLLNSKKAKIRELTRVIEDSGKGKPTEQVSIDVSEEEEEPVRPTKAKGKAKGTKRKAPVFADEDAMDVDEDEDDKDDEEDVDDVDPAQMSDNRSTDDEVDEKRADEVEFSDEEDAAPKSRGKAKGKTTKKATTARGKKATTKPKSPTPELTGPTRHTRARDKEIKSPTLVVRDPEPEASGEAFADEMEETDDEL